MAKNYNITIPVLEDPVTKLISYNPDLGTPKAFAVDKGVTRDTSQKVLKISFGDGYEQRVLDGINTQRDVYNLSFRNRAADEIQVIEDYLNANAALSFDFNIDEDTVKVVCDNFNITYQYEDVYSLSAQFRRVYEP